MEVLEGGVEAFSLIISMIHKELMLGRKGVLFTYSMLQRSKQLLGSVPLLLLLFLLCYQRLHVREELCYCGLSALNPHQDPLPELRCLLST